MTFEPLASDFYSYESLLSDQEKEALAELRDWLESEVRRSSTGTGTARSSPQVVKPLAELGVLSFAWDETKPFENSAVFRGFVALELARVDPSVATFVGVQNGLATGAQRSAARTEQRAEWIPKLASRRGRRRLRPHRAALGLRLGAGPAHHRAPRRRQVGPERLEALDRQRHLLGHHDHLGEGRRRRPGQGLHRAHLTPGYTATKIEGKISLRAVQNADITLDDVVVPESLRLQNANSFKDTASVLRLTRAEVAWAAVGTAIGAYEAGVAYAERARAVRQADRVAPAHPGPAREDASATSPPRSAWSCASPRCSTAASSATSTRRSRRRTRRRGCARPWRWAREASAATASCSTTTSPASSPTPRRSTPTRAPAR